MQTTLHRYSQTPLPGDLGLDDLAVMWGVMKDENLAETFFHDGGVASLRDFIRYATDPGAWFYGVRHGGAFIGFGVANGFSPSGNTAFVHLCSFKGGRKAGDSASSPFADAGRQWFALLHQAGGIDTAIAVFPACYHSVRQWVKLFGFTQRMRIPGALRLVRRSGVRIADAIVCEKQCGEATGKRR